MNLHPGNKFIVLALFVLLLAVPVFSADAAENLGHTTLIIPAVEKTEEGYKGSLATIEIFLKEGDGHVFVDTLPLTEIDTQASARIAKSAVEESLNIDMDKYDIFFVIRSDAPTISGPSAGGAMATGLLSIMLNITPDTKVAMTGTISPDGSIGKVGGIFEKAEAVAEKGVKILLIPRGQRMISEQARNGSENQTNNSIDIKEYSSKRWNLSVIEVSDIRQALQYTTGYRLVTSSPNITEDHNLESAMKKMAEDFLEYAENKLYETEAKMNSSKIPDDRKEIFKNSLIEQKKKIEDSKKALESGEYYTSSSFSFSTSIELSNLAMLADYFNADDKEAYTKMLITNTENNIKNVADEVSKRKSQINSLNDMEVILLSYERINEANTYIKEAWKKFYSGSYEEIIFFVAYSSERADTINRWIALSDAFRGKSFTFDFNDIGSLTRLRLMETISLLNYADLLGIETSSVENMINIARANFNDGDYALTLFNTIAIKSSLESQMEIASTDFNDSSVVGERIERLESNALRNIKACQENGITPIMAINYYEYGKHFEESSPEVAINYLIYSKNFAKISRDVVEVYQGRNFSKDFSLVSVLERKEMPPYSVEIMILIAFLTGILTGILVRPFLKQEEGLKRKARITPRKNKRS